MSFHESLRYEYDLKPESLVLDLGAYHGQFSKILSEKVPCIIHAFEPVPAFFEIAFDTLRTCPNVTLHNYAVGPADMDVIITVNGDRSGAFEDGEEKVVCRQMGIEDVLNVWCEGSMVDLMKVNIEGGEFDLLDFILNNELQYKFRNISVQFHDVVINAHQRYQNIRERLLESHWLTYDYPFMWQNFKLK